MLNSASLVAEYDFSLVINYITADVLGWFKNKVLLLSDGVLNPLFEILRI